MRECAGIKAVYKQKKATVKLGIIVTATRC